MSNGLYRRFFKESFKEYMTAKGTATTREKFLKFLKTERGVDELGVWMRVAATNKSSETVIVPL